MKSIIQKHFVKFAVRYAMLGLAVVVFATFSVVTKSMGPPGVSFSKTAMPYAEGEIYIMWEVEYWSEDGAELPFILTY